MPLLTLVAPKPLLMRFMASINIRVSGILYRVKL